MIVEKKVEIYKTDFGIEPFSVWFNSLDNYIASRILDRIERLKDGNLGDWKSLRGGLFELRMHFGAGYRVYFSIQNGEVIILLCGGRKSQQQKDINQARRYLFDYKRRFL